MKRNVLNSPRLVKLKKHRRRIVFSKIFLFLISLSVIFLSLAYISRSEELNISEIRVVGNKIIDASAVKIAVEKEITGYYLWVFPKTNIFFYPQNKIKNDLTLQFKRLKSITLSVKNYKTLEISLIERTALYTWCGNNIPDSQVNGEKELKCYFLDDSGYIFDEAPYFSGEVYFKFYGPADIGTYFSKENFNQLIYFKDALTTMDLKPVSLSILENERVKIFLSSNKTSKQPYIIFKINSDFRKVAENLEIALDTEPLLSNLKNKYSSLEYIDLRYGNKVYYKFR